MQHRPSCSRRHITTPKSHAGVTLIVGRIEGRYADLTDLRTKHLKEPKQVAIRISYYKLAVTNFKYVFAIALVFNGKVKRDIRIGQRVCKRLDLINLNLNVKALSERVFYGQVPVIKRSSFAYLVNHDLCPIKAEVAKTIFWTFIKAFKTQNLAVEIPRFQPISYCKFRDY